MWNNLNYSITQIINLDKRQRDNLMLFLFADEELKSKQALLNGTDSELFQLRIRGSSTTSYHNDKGYDKTYTYCWHWFTGLLDVAI